MFLTPIEKYNLLFNVLPTNLYLVNNVTAVVFKTKKSINTKCQSFLEIEQ